MGQLLIGWAAVLARHVQGAQLGEVCRGTARDLNGQEFGDGQVVQVDSLGRRVAIAGDDAVAGDQSTEKGPTEIVPVGIEVRLGLAVSSDPEGVLGS